jgi:hypothetical protein
MGLYLLFVQVTLLSVRIGTCQESETKPKPQPTPTPAVKVIRESRPQRLGDIAWKIKLGGAAVKSEDEAIVLTNESVQQLAGERMLTERGQTNQKQPDDTQQLQKRAEARESRRKHWRKQYDKQLQKVRKVEAELAMADIKVDSALSAYRQTLGSGAPEVKARARLDEAKGKRQVVAERLAREKSRLQTIISQARRDGARPGWFR